MSTTPRRTRAEEEATPTTPALEDDDGEELEARDEATDPFPAPADVPEIPSRAEKRAAAKKAATVPPPKGKSRYVVWAHGALRHNGTRYEPGVSLELSAVEAAAIGETVSLSSE